MRVTWIHGQLGGLLDRISTVRQQLKAEVERAETVVYQAQEAYDKSSYLYRLLFRRPMRGPLHEMADYELELYWGRKKLAHIARLQSRVAKVDGVTCYSVTLNRDEIDDIFGC